MAQLKVKGGEKPMRKTPIALLKRMKDVDHAWSNLRPTKSFAGLTLEQYREKIKTSDDARADVAASESKLAADTAKRIAVDEINMELVSRVVSGVKADVDEGEDGELYAAMGFVRKSHRSTGLSRRKTNGNAVPATAKPGEDGTSS
jgi:hypothetical protein